MSETVPTIAVKREGGKGHRLINLDSFDPKLHERYYDPLDHDLDGAAGGSLPEDLATLTAAKLKEVAEARGVDIGGLKSKADIVAALEAAAAAAPAVEAEAEADEA